MKILELRNNAEEQLGGNFNIKIFHDIILKNGSIPLEVLEEIINSYIENEKLSVTNNPHK